LESCDGLNLHSILIGTDFSRCSEAALQSAKALAKRCQARIAVVHVISESLYKDVPSELLTEAKAHTIADVETELEHMRSELKDVPAEFFIQEGSPSEVLLWLSETKSVDLLAVGSHGHRRMQRLLIGSVAEKLSRQARCPVLVTPESSLPQNFSLRTILCPTNFSERSAAALRKTWRLAQLFSAHVLLLHVVEDSALSRADRISRSILVEKALAQLSSSLSGGERLPEAEFAVHFGAPAETIIEVAGERSADLIVLSIQRAKPLVAHLPPEVTFSVVAQAPCPVLTFPS
jgi:nucleotide-binding universal stress UspA family protein